MRRLINKLMGKEKHETLNEEIADVSLELRDRYLSLQKEVLREAISNELATLKDEVNVEKILADLGEDYLLRRDFDSALLETNVNRDPVLILRFSKQRPGAVERTDRLVPLARYSLV